MFFSELGLIPELVKSCGYEKPTPIQLKAIPYILAGQDVIAGSQTGTGKTAAFALPLLHTLSKKRDSGHDPLGLVLTPTRELAAQVGKSIHTYGRGLNIQHTVIFGGVPYKPQMKAFKRGIDILVATPGRLLDHVHQKTINLSNVEHIVLDEADRMIDMGFIDDIKKLIEETSVQRQIVMFSATYSREIKGLASTFLKNHVEVSIETSKKTVDSIEQKFVYTDSEKKRGVISFLVGSNNWKQVLVFTKTKRGADKLAKQLTLDGLSSVAMHGNKSQAQRLKALERFKKGAVRVLVATDVASRGLDIYDLPHVINFDLPMIPEDYIHRIGRTGRAGASGEALSLVSREDGRLLKSIERLLKTNFNLEIVSGFEPKKPDWSHRNSLNKKKRRRPLRNKYH